MAKPGKNAMIPGAATPKYVRLNDGLAHALFIVCPHSQDANDLLLGKNFINKTMLNIDTSRISAVQVTHQLFE